MYKSTPWNTLKVTQKSNNNRWAKTTSFGTEQQVGI